MIKILARALKKAFFPGGGESLPTPAVQDPKMGPFYSQFLRPGDLCFDVGANMGNRVEVFLEIGARVVAIEPQDDCVRALKKKYGADQNFQLIQTALGASEGEAEMLVGNAHTISSLSPEWVKSVKASGRFPGITWDKKQKVPITTLDRLIHDFGEPAFIKIDVEGFEFEVIGGLSRPVKALSFEFTPEFMQAVRNVISHLVKLGDAKFNYSLGESMVLELQEWVDATGMEKILSGLENVPVIFGDIYVRFPV